MSVGHEKNRNSGDRGYLSTLKLNRYNAWQLLLVAVVLGVGVNLLATDLAAHLSSGTAFVVGLVAVVLALGFLAWRALWPRPRLRRFRGFFVYDSADNALTQTDSRYGLGVNLKRYLDAAFAENPAIKSAWDANPISDLNQVSNDHNRDARKSLLLIREAAEYFLLRRFSMSLSEYFRSAAFDPNELETLSHTDIPDVLLQNRFMKLFAEPMDERAAFLDGPFSSPADADVTSVEFASGVLYERFQLVLPQGWDVRRGKDNQIEIVTSRFILTFGTECPGFGVDLPALYISRLLGLDTDSDGHRDRFRPFAVDVSIRIVPRRAWLVTPRSWRYYQWIDDWIVGLEPDVSLDTYLGQIGWGAAETAFMLINRAFDDDIAVTDGGTQGQIPHEFVIGDRVEHATFGGGEIVGEEAGGIALVQFDRDADHEIRKLMWSYAPIRVL